MAEFIHPAITSGLLNLKSSLRKTDLFLEWSARLLKYKNNFNRGRLETFYSYSTTLDKLIKLWKSQTRWVWDLDGQIVSSFCKNPGGSTGGNRNVGFTKMYNSKYTRLVQRTARSGFLILIFMHWNSEKWAIDDEVFFWKEYSVISTQGLLTTTQYLEAELQFDNNGVLHMFLWWMVQVHLFQQHYQSYLITCFIWGYVSNILK